MVPWFWSWLLTFMSLPGIWLAGSKNKIGWALGLVTQVAWIAYGVSSHQYGFILSALVYSVVYVRNYAKWRTP